MARGSAEQRASAILAFLLNFGDEPLIIDQPEDDLDNAMVYDLIVSQIHKIEGKRQLIVATHNPNIVVNGDADWITVLEYKNGQVRIHKQGNLMDQGIRDSICSIMEGGREAFEKLYKKITMKDQDA